MSGRSCRPSAMCGRTHDQLRPSPAVAEGAPSDVEVGARATLTGCTDPLIRVPDPDVVSRGFVPDSRHALLTVRSHLNSPAVLARDGRGRCPPLRVRESPASCGADQPAGSA